MTPSLYPAHWTEGGSRCLGYIDATGSITVRVAADAVFPFVDGLARIKRAGKFGAIDPTGCMAVDCTLVSATDFQFGLALASPDGTTRGLIDCQGRWVLPPAVRELSVVSSELYCSKETGEAGWYLRTWTGEKCAGPYRFSVGQLRSARILVCEEDGRYRFLDAAGRPFIDVAYTEAFPFSEGWALVARGEDWSYVDPDGRSCLSVDFGEYPGGSPFHAGFAPVGRMKDRRKVEYFFIDRGGFVVLGPYAAMKDFTELGAPVQDPATQQWGIVNRHGEWILKPEWFLVDGFAGELARAFRDAPIRGKAHYVNGAGHVVWIDGVAH